jgi:heat shock protein HslJ
MVILWTAAACGGSSTPAPGAVAAPTVAATTASTPVPTPAASTTEEAVEPGASITATSAATDTVALTDSRPVTTSPALTDAASLTEAAPVTSSGPATGTIAVPAEGELVGSAWLLTAVDGVQALGGVAVAAVFSVDGSLFGPAGCNKYNATYTAADGQITVSNLTPLSDYPCDTEQAELQEEQYLDILGRAANYAIEGLSLELCNANSTDCLQYASAATLVVEGTSWIANSYRKDQGEVVDILPEGPAITAIFADSIVQGFGGCANYQGRYEVAGESFSLEQLAVIQAGNQVGTCDPAVSDQQALYLKALELTESYSIEGVELVLLDGAGEPVAIYTAANLP